LIAYTLSIKDIQVGQILIRGVDDVVLQSLKERAMEHGRSLEAELRQVLTEAARKPRTALVRELAEIRALTPAGPRMLSEDFVREGRDER
jgi:plasmid stability protein